MLGLRPIVEIMTINFIVLAMDQIVNHAAKIYSMFGGQCPIPLVIRTPGGGGQQLSATHSQNLEVWFAHVPGLKVVAPSTPADAKGLLRAAVRDNNPVIFLENLALYNVKGDVPGGDYTIPIGQARVTRDGADLTEQQLPIREASTAPPVPMSATLPQAAAAQARTQRETEISPLSPMQTIIAHRLTAAKQTIPHFYVTTEVDMTDILAVRQTLNASVGEGGVKVTVNDLIVKACALALEKFPEVNSSFKENQLIHYKHTNIGIAVDIPSGLVVPVIHDANSKGVRTIARETKALIEKARIHRLSTSDLEGGTFSLSNLGMLDVTDFVAVINPPQAAILAVASIRKRFVPMDGQPVIRDLMPMTISADHRILYGATVARFLQEIKRLLQPPTVCWGKCFVSRLNGGLSDEGLC